MAPVRLPLLPAVPTLAEAGMAGLDVAAWFGLLAPVRTPDDIIRRIGTATLDALAQPEVRTALEAIGGIPKPMAADAFAAFIARENERWGKAIRDVGVTPLGTSTRSIGTPQ
jgi:tripartite-type tricarboxylate transporter receptor subunit TctC